MTLAEFKAWFEGYTESLDGPPNAKQWKRIKGRVKEIDGETVTRRVFVDHLWPRRFWDQPYISYCANKTAADDIVRGSGTTLEGKSLQYDSGAAMQALGMADAAHDAGLRK